MERSPRPLPCVGPREAGMHPGRWNGGSCATLPRKSLGARPGVQLGAHGLRGMVTPPPALLPRTKLPLRTLVRG